MKFAAGGQCWPLPPPPSESLGVIYDLEGLGRNWEGLGSAGGGQFSVAGGLFCTRKASRHPYGCLRRPRTKNRAKGQACAPARIRDFRGLRPTYTAVHISERRGLGVDEWHGVRKKMPGHRRFAVICRAVVADHFRTSQTAHMLACEPQWCIWAHFWAILPGSREICRRRPMFAAPSASL